MRAGGRAKSLAVALGLNAVVIGGAWAWITVWRACGLAAVLGDSTGLLTLLVVVPATLLGLAWALRRRTPALVAPPPPGPAREAVERTAPAAVPVSGESADALRAKLFVAGVCTPTDLEANRAGRMSTRQRVRAVLHTALASLLAAATLGWAAHVIRDDTIRDRAGHLLPIGERLVGAGLYTLFGVALALYALSLARVVTAPVVFVDGHPVAGISYGARGAVLHHVDVGGRQLSTGERTRGALRATARYRAYHAAGAHELLSIEPLDEG